MKGDQMGILAAYPTQRELPLSNQTRFNNTLWTSAGGPGSEVVGWLNRRTLEETGN